LPELRAFTAQVSDAQRRKRHLADDLPTGPGVYVFRDAQGTPLYVGTSRNLRVRVRQYFVASETRSRMGEMVGLAERVDPIECAHPLEAQVRELRLIAAYKPRYNRRSKFPERAVWLKLTNEPFPRLSVVHAIRLDGAAYLGPLRSVRQAEAVRDAIHDAVPLRQCTDRLSVRRAVRAACVLAGIGRCSAPCEGGQSPEAYAALAELVRAAWSGDVRPLVDPLRARLVRLAAAERFEHAAVVRDRIAAVVRACARMQRIASLTVIEELVAAHPDGCGGWELAVIKYGRLAAAGVAEVGVPPWTVIDALLATADAVLPDTLRPGPLPAALAEETECVLRWLEQPGTRLVLSSRPWTCPAFGAGGFRSYLETDSVRRAADPFAEESAGAPGMSRATMYSSPDATRFVPLASPRLLNVVFSGSRSPVVGFSPVIPAAPTDGVAAIRITLAPDRLFQITVPPFETAVRLPVVLADAPPRTRSALPPPALAMM